MGEQVKQITDGIKKAMQAELEGHNFYMMAASTTQDSQGKRIFETLAKEELNHFQFLKAQYISYEKAGVLDQAAALGMKMTFSKQHPIFSSAIIERIKEAHFEMTALSVGIQLELNAITFYKNQATAISDQQVKLFYTELADWETGHYQALLQQYESLKQAYWEAAGFAPF